MKLDDLKNTWDSQNSNAAQQRLTSITDEVIQEKYRSKVKKIAYPEIIGSLVCVAAAVFICSNFDKLDTTFLQSVGVVSILLLIILPVISFLSLRQLTRAEDVNKPYAETLKSFAIQKIRFYKLQKLNITLSYLLLVTIIILLSKLFGGKDLADNKYFWTFFFTIGYICLLFFSTYVFKFYKSTLSQAEELLQDVGS